MGRLAPIIISIIMGLVLVLAASSPAFSQGTETGISAYSFDLSEVSLTSGRWMDNQERTLRYLKWIDVDRLLYNFRANHQLSTQGAQPNGGWDAPDFRFRSHIQGHFLTSWAHCYAVLRDDVCRNHATYFVAELAKCQANNEAAGFGDGYLSGYPESEFAALENGTLDNGNVPYYTVHKTLAGLLDVWRHIGDTTARDVLLSLAGWVDGRTGLLSYDQMQKMMETEFGGMNEVLADIYHQTGDERWLTAAQRFDHAAVFSPLAADRDELDGLHANTQVPKWIGAAREFKATGTARYRDIARNAWDITVDAHAYAIGGNSQAEHFHEPDAVAQYLTNDTCETCNSYNMLKLTRELWLMDPETASYFDFYERTLLNHLLGVQNPADSHGHITYFTPLNPGGHRGVGPALGGGTWSTDYDSFWCCQGSGMETNSKLMDSIYFHDNNNSTLYVNLFTPSVLTWSQRDVTVTQTTAFPVNDTTTLEVDGSGDWAMRIRIPAWTSDAEISINGQTAEDIDISAEPGTYALLDRSWSPGDTVTVRLPMTLRTMPANDDPNIAAVAYGPVVLCGDYGNSSLSAMPTLALDSVNRTGSNSAMEFTATTADGQTVRLVPFYNAQGFNYNVYWGTSGELPAPS